MWLYLCDCQLSSCHRCRRLWSARQCHRVSTVGSCASSDTGPHVQQSASHCQMIFWNQLLTPYILSQTLKRTYSLDVTIRGVSALPVFTLLRSTDQHLGLLLLLTYAVADAVCIQCLVKAARWCTPSSGMILYTMQRWCTTPIMICGTSLIVYEFINKTKLTVLKFSNLTLKCGFLTLMVLKMTFKSLNPKPEVTLAQDSS